MAYRFGPFVYDPVSRGLLRAGAEIALTHKSRELLLLFLNNPGRLLTRDDLVMRVWPDVVVTDDAVRFQVAELRKALGEDGSAFIRTIRREGYRWEAPIHAVSDRPVRPVGELEPEAHLPHYRLVLEKREVQLLAGENIVGRDPDAALWIDHPLVSRRHARILVADGRATIEDLGSKNGTYVKGARIDSSVSLADGDELRIGPETMVFRAMNSPTTQTERTE